MLTEGDPKPQIGEPGLDQLAVILLQDQSPAPRGCDDPYGVTAAHFRG
jgi:hypothetical protein